MARSYSVRLNPDGSLDTAFNPGPNGAVVAIAVQPDGKIMLGGRFTALGGQARARIGRINSDGSLDAAFGLGAEGPPDLNGVNPRVLSIALQPDGKIVVGGVFTTLGGQPHNHLGRLNPDGTLDAGFNPVVSGRYPSILAMALQKDGQVVIGGGFETIGGLPRNHIGRINPDGSVDAIFDPGANSISPDVSVLTVAVEPGGSILVGGGFDGLGGEPRNFIGRLLADGRINPSDCPEARFNPSPNGSLLAMAVQADGKILIGGSFSALGGQPRNFLGRYNSDGSVDADFNPGANNLVYSIVVQPDGKILVGGAFTRLGGALRSRIGRLNPDGTLDTSFNPGVIGPNPYVLAIALQANGKILVGGMFDGLGGDPRKNFGRLNEDGSPDITFGPVVDAIVTTIALQPGGKILVVDSVTADGRVGRGRQSIFHLGRLNPDGSRDSSFSSEGKSGLSVIALQADRKILVGGEIGEIDGEPRIGIGRLNPDGTLDVAFDPETKGDAPAVHAIALQADGKILVGGEFDQLGGEPRSNIGRLNADGSVDSSFIFEPNDLVSVIALQADGKILVAGRFSAPGSQQFRNFARLPNTTPALQSLVANKDGTRITWLRSGASPEVTRVTFDISTDRANYTFLARGKRIRGGWRARGLNLPKNQDVFIRARGYEAGSVIELVSSPMRFSPD